MDLWVDCWIMQVRQRQALNPTVFSVKLSDGRALFAVFWIFFFYRKLHILNYDFKNCKHYGIVTAEANYVGIYLVLYFIPLGFENLKCAAE